MLIFLKLKNVDFSLCGTNSVHTVETAAAADLLHGGKANFDEEAIEGVRM
jgi:hypothetical protein